MDNFVVLVTTCWITVVNTYILSRNDCPSVLFDEILHILPSPSPFHPHLHTLTIIPLGQLHRPMIIQMLVHIKAIPQQMRLMSPPLPQALKLGFIKVILQNRHIVRVRALLNNYTSTLAGTQAPHVGESLLGDDDIEIVFRLIDVCAHGHDAGHACGIGLCGTRRGSVHDGVFRGPQEIRTASEAVEHAAAHDACRIRVCVDVDFDGRVHTDNTEAADNLGAVTDLLRAQEEFGRVLIPVLVEALEAVGGEADGGRGCEVEVPRVEKVQEGVLEDFGPDFEVFEVCTARL
jgi:ferredoxin